MSLSRSIFQTKKNIKELNSKITLQGNLNPETLRTGGTRLKKEIKEILLAFKETPHIFNLGHGVIKDTPVENVFEALNIIRS